MTIVIVPMPQISKLSATCSAVTVEIDTKGNTYDGFRIYRSPDGKTVDFTDTTTSTVYVDTDVILGEKYYYLVSGIVGEYESSGDSLESITVAHVELTEEEQAATCTEDGYTAYTYCDSCDTVLSGKEVLPKTGHSYELTEEEIPATTTSAGKTAVYTCANCSDSYGGDEIPMIQLGNGDVNNDGEISLIDVLRSLKATIGEYIPAADIDGDGTISVADVLEILKLTLNG